MIYSWNFFGKCPIPFMKFIVKIDSAGAQSRFYLFDIISVWNWGFGTSRMIFMKTNSYLLEKSLKIDVWAIRDGNSLKNLLCKLFLLVPNLNLCLIKSSHYRTILGNFWNPFRICPIQSQCVKMDLNKKSLPKQMNAHSIIFRP